MESNVLGQATRVALKSLIIDVLVLGSAAVRTQLIEVICCMALHDFPESWPDLIDKLLSKISADNFSVNLVILKACHYIFKRYRREMRSDELYTEINYVMSRFGPALLQLYRGLEGVLKASDSGDSGHIKLLLQNVTYANKIFYSLSFQDIPAHIEDNLGEFMRLLLAFFAFHSARPDLASSPDQAGILEKLASSAAKVFALYAEKYEEDFTMLPAVAEATWVTLTSRVSQLPKDDKLAFVCLDFLASIARQERHKVLFQPILQILCEQIIVPNLAIRDTDMEVFEDDPMEFIRRESDSSLEDSSSRSSVAIVLTRNLTEFFEQDMTRILFQAIQQQLQVSY
jgi:exportin-2 (importin alpha re-exporter)